MIKYFSHICLVLCLIVLTSAQQTACNKKKISSTAVPVSEAKPVDFLKTKHFAQMPQGVNMLSAKAKLSFAGDGNSIQATANIIWVKDSMLWLNVKKFGIEGVRALVTKDSIYILDRLQKTYSIKSWDALQKEYHLPAGFELLENLILAKAWFSPEIKLQSDVKDEMYRLNGTEGRYTADYRLEGGTFRLNLMTFLEQKEARTVTFGFNQYEKLSGTGFLPYLRTIDTFSPDTGETHIEVELSEVETNIPKTWRFEIPDHYKKSE